VVDNAAIFERLRSYFVWLIVRRATEMYLQPKRIIEACEILASHRCQIISGATYLYARPTIHPNPSGI
jgi:hypothetical protein